jgi:hypothetical protein
MRQLLACSEALRMSLPWASWIQDRESYCISVRYILILSWNLYLDHSHFISFYELLTRKKKRNTTNNLKWNTRSDVSLNLIWLWECFKGSRINSWRIFSLLSFLRKGRLMTKSFPHWMPVSIPLCVWNIYSAFPWNMAWNSRRWWLLKLYTSLIPCC